MWLCSNSFIYKNRQLERNACRPCFLNPTLVPSLTFFRWVSEWKLLSRVRLFAIPWTVHGILPARIPEGVAFPFSRGSSQPRDWIQVSRSAGGFLGERHLISQITMSSGSVFQLRLQSFPTTRCPHQTLEQLNLNPTVVFFSASPHQWFQWAAQAKGTIFIGNFCFPFLLGKLQKRTAWLHHRGPASWVGRICSTHFWL